MTKYNTKIGSFVLELKSVEFYDSPLNEFPSYKATLYVNGFACATIFHRGDGGTSSMYMLPNDTEFIRELLKEVEKGIRESHSNASIESVCDRMICGISD